MAGNLAQLGMVTMGLVGLISVMKARRTSSSNDPAADSHLAERMEMERRMGSYLAERDDTRRGASDERR